MILHLVKPGFYSCAAVSLTTLLLKRCAVVLTSQETQSGDEFQPAMISRRQPEGQEPEYGDCFQPLHAHNIQVGGECANL